MPASARSAGRGCGLRPWRRRRRRRRPAPAAPLAPAPAGRWSRSPPGAPPAAPPSWRRRRIERPCRSASRRCERAAKAPLRNVTGDLPATREQRKIKCHVVSPGPSPTDSSTVTVGTSEGAMVEQAVVQRRRGGREARRELRAQPIAEDERAVRPGLAGGRYRALSDAEVTRIHRAALDVLEQIGLADPIPSCVELITTAGGTLGADGRLRLPRALVEDVLAGAGRRFVLPCRRSEARSRALGYQGLFRHRGRGGAHGRSGAAHLPRVDACRSLRPRASGRSARSRPLLPAPRGDPRSAPIRASSTSTPLTPASPAPPSTSAPASCSPSTSTRRSRCCT